MISDEERRRFAENLRCIAQHPPEWATSACAIAEVFDADYPLWEDSGELFDMLADLIEPTTCTVRMGVTGHIGVCMRCGAMVEMSTAVFDAIEALPTRYCPNCGAEVKNEAD